MKKLTPQQAQDFWDKVLISPNPDDCWIWTAAARNAGGYGSFELNGKTVHAHRVAYFIEYGDIGDKFVLHKCNNEACVRPSHLYLGTQSDNVRDAVIAGTNSFTKLTPNQVREIRTLEGLASCRKIGELYGVTEGCVRRIFEGKTWSHLE